MATQASVTGIPSDQARTRGRRASHRQPVVVAGAIGAVLATFELYVLVAWIAGPNFQRVTPGPSVMPEWMKIACWSAQVIGVLLAIGLAYWFVVRPWRRERHVPFDGLLVISAVITSLYDPLSNYFHSWFTYNSYFVNFGNPMTAVPGWQSFHAPGQQTAWPFLFIPPIYIVFFLAIPALGCAFMRFTYRRLPRVPAIGHVLFCFGAIFVIDSFTEGTIIMRLGFYEHTGSSFSFLDSYYGHNALRNIIFVAFAVTAAVCLRFYKNDRGETVVERGISQILTSPGKRTGLRLLATLAAIQAILLIGFHAPVAISTLLNPKTPWHADMVQHSYLNDHICGYGTPRTCPPPGQ